MPYTLPIGIPDPTWGSLDAINSAVPTQPAEWPSASNASWYYVDSDHVSATDTANTNGYPNQPRLTIPTTLAAGSKVVVVKMETYVSIAATGTENSPIWILGYNTGTIIPGIPSTFLGITNCSYVIVDGVIFDGTGCADTSGSVAWSIASGSNHICIRNCVVQNMVVGWYNPDRFGSGGAAAWYTGITNISPSSADVNDIILYANNISNNAGGQDLDYENGRHCIIASGDSDGIYRVERVWILANTFHNNPEDGIQLGQTAAGSDKTLCRYFYIGDNTISNNGENAIDLKACDKVVISQNRMFGYKKTSYRVGAVSGSDGTACVINDDGGGAAESWWLFNEIYDSRCAFRNQSDTSIVYIIGNIVHDLTMAAGDAEPDTAGDFEAVAYFQSAYSSDIYLINNTIYNTHGGFHMNNVSDATVMGNIVYKLGARATNWPININNSATITNSQNIYYDPLGNVRQDANAIGVTDTVNTNPLLDSSYRLEYSSIARDRISDTTIYDLYLATYGENILVDYNRVARVAPWDSGAKEFIPISRPTKTYKLRFRLLTR